MPCTRFYALILYTGEAATLPLLFVSQLLQVLNPKFRERRKPGIQYVVSQSTLGKTLRRFLIVP
jgi:hypothetical protein